MVHNTMCTVLQVTVFALLDAAAIIYFARQFGVASIGERLLIEQRLLNSVGIRR